MAVIEYDGSAQVWKILQSLCLRQSNPKIGVNFKQDSIWNSLTIVPITWILLDNQSTVCVFFNRNLITNICTVNTAMDIYCNVGVVSPNQVGDLKGFGTVWLNPDGIANILSRAEVEKRFRITYDSKSGKGFTVHKDDGSTRQFKISNRGLYYHDTVSSESIKENKDMAFVKTVADNASNCSTCDYSRALAASKLQDIIGRPSAKDFINIVDMEYSVIDSCPILKVDIVSAEDILGGNL